MPNVTLDPSLTTKAEEMIAAGQPAAAIELFRSVASSQPCDLQAFSTVQRLFVGIDQGRFLVDFYRDLQKSEPENIHHLLNLAKVYSSTGKDSLAVVQLQKLLRADSGLKEGWTELAMCYIRLNKQELAQRALNSLLDLHPECSEAHVERVRVFLLAGDTQEALANTIFSLESPAVNSQLRTWLEEIDEHLELNIQPSSQLLAAQTGLSAFDSSQLNA